MSESLPRNLIAENHPVFQGESVTGDWPRQGWRKLSDGETIQDKDETACVSCLLSYTGDRWTPAWEAAIGKIVAEEAMGDMDGRDRVWRRRRE